MRPLYALRPRLYGEGHQHHRDGQGHRGRQGVGVGIDKCTEAFQWPPPEHNPFLQEPSPIYVYGRALEGARGCIRACMIHLEETGRISRTFKNPFRKRKPWKIESG